MSLLFEAQSLLYLSPRSPFTVALGDDAFLCYAYGPLTEAVDALAAHASRGDGPGAKDVDRSKVETSLLAHGRQVWSYLGNPTLVVVGPPYEGMSVYRPSTAALTTRPIWDPTDGDPGRIVGHLVRSTIEATKRVSVATLADLDALRDQGHLVPDTIHTSIGDRSTWAVDGTDVPLVRLSAVMQTLIPHGRIGEGPVFATHDLDLCDAAGSYKAALRRARDAVFPLGGLDRALANGSLTPDVIHAAHEIDTELVDRVFL